MRPLTKTVHSSPSKPHMVVMGCFLLIACCVQFAPVNEPTDPEKIAVQYCGGCHLTPDPADLPRQLWGKTVLPEMGSYYGIQTKGFGRLKQMTTAELAEIDALNLYPEQPTIPPEDWKAIQQYYLSKSPLSIDLDLKRKRRNKKLQAFEAEDIDLLSLPGSLITSLSFNQANNQLWVGEDRLMAYAWVDGQEVTNRLQTGSTVSHVSFDGAWTYLVEMGSLIPTPKRIGSIAALSENGEKKTIINGLHRPVHALAEDLNHDGSTELVISNFGHRGGSLSLYTDLQGEPKEVELHRQAGALKCLSEDMDGDGQKDLVALFAQGDESIFIFYQQESLTFKKERVLRFHPLSGSNDFVLIDYEGDGDLDIVVAQGDNADISVTHKPYHGIRLFINEQGAFIEKFFHPLYGATKVLAEDFDQDGDTDFVATAFYQQYETVPNEGLIYLENLDARNFEFQSFELKNRDPIKSYALEKGDIDGDGDVDIVVGLFSSTITKVPPALQEKWHQASYDITVLRNSLK